MTKASEWERNCAGTDTGRSVRCLAENNTNSAVVPVVASDCDRHPAETAPSVSKRSVPPAQPRSEEVQSRQVLVPVVIENVHCRTRPRLHRQNSLLEEEHIYSMYSTSESESEPASHPDVQPAPSIEAVHTCRVIFSLTQKN